MQNFTDKEIFRRFQNEIACREKLGFEVEYEGKDFVLEEERTFIYFWVKILYLCMVTYNIICD